MGSTMKKYRSHKEVLAFKIERIVESLGIGTMCELHATRDEGTSFVSASAGYIDKHKPTVGGYYVLYADGYESFSPAEAFEEGYTEIEKAKGDDNVWEFYRDDADKWRWRCSAVNGNILFVSAQGYVHMADAVVCARRALFVSAQGYAHMVDAIARAKRAGLKETE